MTAGGAGHVPSGPWVGDPTSPRSVALWFALLAPPLAWAAHVVVGDLLFELGCAPGARGQRFLGLPLEWWAIGQSVLLAGVCAGAGLLAWRARRELGGRADGTRLLRARAMALGGLASAGLFLATILMGATAPLVLRGCEVVP